MVRLTSIVASSFALSASAASLGRPEKVEAAKWVGWKNIKKAFIL
jgi:hypothetical protein